MLVVCPCLTAQVGFRLQVEVRYEHHQAGLPAIVGFDVGAAGWLKCSLLRVASYLLLCSMESFMSM